MFATPHSSSRFWAFWRLARFDRPIGIALLLWPTLWAVWIASEGHPAWSIVLIFSVGVILMRAAGCVVNDIADRNFDKQVWRTQDRPLAKGDISTTEAILFFLSLLACAAALLFFLNQQTFYWALVAAALAALYPFMKRFTYLPQLVLAAAFSWGIPMAFVAQDKVPTEICWLIFLANLAWTVAYDTYYAMADREDDKKAGIKSIAILLDDMDLVAIIFLQSIFIITLLLLGQHIKANTLYYVSIGIAAAFFAYQFILARDRDKHHCLKAFLNNHWVGLVIFVGILLHYYGHIFSRN